VLTLVKASMFSTTHEEWHFQRELPSKYMDLNHAKKFTDLVDMEQEVSDAGGGEVAQWGWSQIDASAYMQIVNAYAKSVHFDVDSDTETLLDEQGDTGGREKQAQTARVKVPRQSGTRGYAKLKPDELLRLKHALGVDDTDEQDDRYEEEGDSDDNEYEEMGDKDEKGKDEDEGEKGGKGGADGGGPDLGALLALRRTVAGLALLPGWKDLETHRDLSKCEGITITTKGGRVTRVELRNKRLSGTLPVEVRQLTALEYFNVYDNQLSGMCVLVPVVAPDIPAVAFFFLKTDSIRALYAGALPSFATCVALTEFKCYENQFTGA
jgi:hypothetical protein